MSEDHGKLDRAFAGGVAWTAGAKWVTQVITWLSVFVAAKLLSPDDFGAVEMASFATILTNVLAEFGIGTTVLQMRDLDRHTLAQLNSVSLLFSAFAFAVSSAFTPLIAAFFRTNQLIPLMLVNNLSYFITGFQAVPMGLLERDLDYRRISIAESAQGITQAVATVSFAYAGFGYWALLAGPLSGKLVMASLIVFWRPLPFALPKWREVLAPMRFGFQVAISRLAWAVYSQADTIIIGRVLGKTALGTYRMAISIATAPADKIVFLIMRVTGPLFARVQKDRALVKRYFLFISDALALITFPLIAGLIVVAPEVVSTLGPQWEGAIGPTKWLAAYMILRPLSTLTSQILISFHLSSFCMWMTLMASVVMPTAFYLAAPHGGYAVAIMWLVMSPVILGPLVWRLFREIQCSAWEYLALMTPPVLASSVMALAVIAVKLWLIPAGTSKVWTLGYEIVTGGIVYGAVLLVFYRPLVMRYVNFVMRLRSRSALDGTTADFSLQS